MRTFPSLSATVLRQLQPGDTVTILDGLVQGDDYEWWKIVTSDGFEGWAVGYEPVSTAMPTP